MLPLGGIALSVDGADVDLPETTVYKSMMLSGVPNFAFAIGYTNASWTLKVDLVCEHVCRLLAHMDARGFDTVVAGARPTSDAERLPLFDLTSGYVQRGIDVFPHVGSRGPWTFERPTRSTSSASRGRSTDPSCASGRGSPPSRRSLPEGAAAAAPGTRVGDEGLQALPKLSGRPS